MPAAKPTGSSVASRPSSEASPSPALRNSANVVSHELLWVPIISALGGGAFAIFEARAGWCIVRAMGFEPRSDRRSGATHSDERPEQCEHAPSAGKSRGAMAGSVIHRSMRWPATVHVMMARMQTVVTIEMIHRLPSQPPRSHPVGASCRG